MHFMSDCDSSSSVVMVGRSVSKASNPLALEPPAFRKGIARAAQFYDPIDDVHVSGPV